MFELSRKTKDSQILVHMPLSGGPVFCSNPSTIDRGPWTIPENQLPLPEPITLGVCI